MLINDNDISESLQHTVKQAIHKKEALFIHGGKSKAFYGHKVDGTPLDVSPHTGIISYEPTELCITLRAGTRLSALQQLLDEHQQLLPFDPPVYSDHATIGGAIAAGIAGPRRAYSGSVRDAILGVEMINGDGDIVHFGGQVMKNVAGYDLSRLMVRSQGTLGVILSISLRLLPKPAVDKTIVLDATQDEALQYFKQYKKMQLPVSATTWFNQQAYIRLSASDTIVSQAATKITGDEANIADDFWAQIRDHTHPFFTHSDKPLWRFSFPLSAKSLPQMEHELMMEWDGAQRWVHSNAPPNIMHSVAKSHDGHATLFRSDKPETTHAPVLEPALLLMHKRLKRKMDPHAIFNPNRLYQGL